jgi:selenoprotein W-related protein
MIESQGKPRVEIQYCTQCRWLLRAAWLAQELLTTFEEDLGGVTLVPASGGTFEINVNSDKVTKLIWSRKHEGRFPEAKEVKQRIRDSLFPDKSLGHSDVKNPS